jgi:cytochrome bd-type quinol oxidase subunit 2
MFVYTPILILSFIAPLLQGIYILHSNDERTNLSTSFNSPQTVAQIIVLCLLGVFAAVLVMARLSKKGTSSELRKIVVQRHLIYILVFVAYTFLIVNNLTSWFFEV